MDILKIESNDKDHLQKVLRHISKVTDNCNVMAQKLIELDQLPLAKELISLGQIHDNSKLSNATEWLYLRDEYSGSKEFQLALESHWSNNPHHPEHWLNGISDMSLPHIGEMVADWKARSEEFGTDLKDWVKNSACEKYCISLQGKKWKEIKMFLNLILEKPFS